MLKGGLTSSLQGHSDIAEELLSRGVDVNSRGLHQVSGLVWAAGRGHDDVVKVLLGEKSNDYHQLKVEILEKVKSKSISCC